jgi:hypothetical protein
VKNVIFASKVNRKIISIAIVAINATKVNKNNFIIVINV